MIFAVVAQTGGGKSMFVMRKVIEALVNTNKHVVTNLAINMPELCEYLTEEHGEMFDAPARVRLLTLDEVGCFWRYYGQGYDLPGTRIPIRGGTGQVREELDYACRDPKQGGTGHGVLYAIDEADEIFDAKSFAGMAHDLRYYARHNRKFTDDVYLIGPAWEFLVKELRVMCHAVWEMENGQQMKLGKIPVVGGMFKGLPWIKGTMWKVRQGGAWGGANEQPRDTTRFLIDAKGVGKTYRTEAGLGVSGNKEAVQKAEKVKGLSPAWIGGIAVAFCVALIMIPKLFATVFAGSVNKVVTKASAGAGVVATNTAQSFFPTVTQRNTEVPKVEQVKHHERQEVWLTARAQLPGGRCIVFLSDGTETETFRVIDTQTVEIDGQRYSFRAREKTVNNSYK